MTKALFKHQLAGKLSRHFSRELSEATPEQMYQACALVIRDLLAQERVETENVLEERQCRQIHYLSMEFLLGRSLINNAYNLGVLEPMRQALQDLGIQLDDLAQVEADPGLGNGGLGRLAACYLDSMATLSLPADGYTIRYSHGIFRQKIIDGEQVEVPDYWLDTGDVWQQTRADDAVEVRFGGTIEEQWGPDGMKPIHRDYTVVRACPHDMLISGYRAGHAARLRLWEAASPVSLDMGLFSRGEYLKAVEQKAMAEVISMVLYPEDNHMEGQALRLKQQYFLVSATVQDIVRHHKQLYGTVRNFAEKHVIHINDTHPTMVIPELMRLLLDEEKLCWEEAWDIVTHTVAYTNHTVMKEALECWHADQMMMLMPRLFQIIAEIDRRFVQELERRWPGDGQRKAEMAILWDGMVRMANLAVIGSFSINGVSALHSKIIRTETFRGFAQWKPTHFQNVTNGIAHRRWLCQCNPGLTQLICELIGDGFLTRPQELIRLRAFAKDDAVLRRLAQIKHENKVKLAQLIYRQNGVVVPPEAIFDVQVKRLHEYKRQLLNVLHIIALYQRLQRQPDWDMPPHLFLFGSKAAPGYRVAKRIIRLIGSVAQAVQREEHVRQRLQVVFLEDYRVSLAEQIMPAAELSEQISLAGTEASGTGNMKFMINGALTIGTLDGANIEISQQAGEENLFLFGLKSHEAAALREHGRYSPTALYQSNPVLASVLDQMTAGFGDGQSYQDLVSLLLTGVGGVADQYFVLADFDSYCQAHARAQEVYADPTEWNRMSLQNIAGAGFFAADRSVSEYAENIWDVRPL